MRQKALIIANSRASRLEGRLTQVKSILSQRLQIEVADVPANAEDERAVLQKLAAVDRVIVGGGDGTLHHLLPLLLKARKPIGVLPLGTANDFAKSIGVPAEIQAACNIASGNDLRPVDIGMMNGRPFLNVASLGIAASVSKMQSSRKKRWLRAFSYAVALLQALKRSRPFHAEIHAGGEPVFRGYVLQASIGNGRYHGGGLTSGPNARIDDSLLHIYTVAARRWWQLLPVVPILLLGLHRWARCLKTFDVSECTLITRRSKQATVDGELLDTKERRFYFEVRPQSLKVFAPPLPANQALSGKKIEPSLSTVTSDIDKDVPSSGNRAPAAGV